MDQASEQVLNIASCMSDAILSLQGVKGVIVVVDWDDPKHAVLGSFHTRNPSLMKALSLVRRGAQMQSHMVNTLLKRGTVIYEKEEPSGDARSEEATRIQTRVPEGPPVGGDPAPSGG